MSGCCAYGCKNRSENQIPGITFHLFPKDPVRRKAWTLAVKRKNFRPTNFTRICSEHFAEECFNRTSKKYVRLLSNAVPTIFKTYPRSLQNISYLTPLTKLYSDNDIIIKKSESDSDEEIDEDEEIIEDEEVVEDEEIAESEGVVKIEEESEEDQEIADDEDDSLSESESSEESACGDAPETEVVYVSEEYTDSDQPSLKVIPECAPKPAKKLKLDKGVRDALYAFSKLQSTSDDLREETVSLVLVQPPPKDNGFILTPQELVNMDPEALKDLYEEHKRELKALRQKTRRYQEKIAKLEKIIDNFKNYKSSDEEGGNAVSEDNISVDEIYEQLLMNQKDDIDSESSNQSL